MSLREYTENMPWRVVPFNQLKKVWEDWIKYGIVRYENSLNKISDIITENIIKAWAITVLLGHTRENPDEYYEDAWGEYVDDYIAKIRFDNSEYYTSTDKDQIEINFDNPDEIKKNSKITKKIEDNLLFDELIEDINLKNTSHSELHELLIHKLMEKFMWYYVEDPKNGHARMSDYGLEPLLKLLHELTMEPDSSDQLVILDRILNIVHQRSDIAGWFVEGGSRSLDKLSASPSEKINIK